METKEKDNFAIIFTVLLIIIIILLGGIIFVKRDNIFHKKEETKKIEKTNTSNTNTTEKEEEKEEIEEEIKKLNLSNCLNCGNRTLFFNDPIELKPNNSINGLSIQTTNGSSTITVEWNKLPNSIQKTEKNTQTTTYNITTKSKIKEAYLETNNQDINETMAYFLMKDKTVMRAKLFWKVPNQEKYKINAVDQKITPEKIEGTGIVKLYNVTVTEENDTSYIKTLGATKEGSYYLYLQ